MNETLIIALITALTSGGTLAFIQYLISRSDNQKEKKDNTLNKVYQMLDHDNRRIKDLEEANKFMYKAISLLLQDDLAILEYLRTNNSTGKMAEQEQKVQEFLIER